MGKSWRRRIPFVFAGLLALIELSGIVDPWTSSGAEILDGCLSAALVFALFGTIFALSALAPRTGARWVFLGVLHLGIASLSTVLYTSWLVRLVLGQPVSGDAASLLAEAPINAILQLRESDRLFLAILGVGLLLFLYAGARVLNVAAKSTPPQRLRTRAVTAGVLAAASGLLTWRVTAAGLTWSSYAVVFAPHAGTSEVPLTYTCPQSEDVPLTAPPVAANNGTPIIMVMVDSLRYDLLQTHPDAMPFLSGLAKESVVFERAYASASHSDYTDLSVWYSRYPIYAEHRLGYPVGAPWRGTSAFEVFRMNGYRTAYFSSQDERWGQMINWLKIDAVETFFDSNNFSDGDRLRTANLGSLGAHAPPALTALGKVEDSHTLQFAGDWLEHHAHEPFFLGMNLQNTHYPYIIPNGGAQPFQPAELDLAALQLAWPQDSVPKVRNRFLNAALNVDRELAQFAQRLRALGVWDRAIVLIIGDNGESFGEHGYNMHGGPMHDEQARTLAVLKLPQGSPRNGTVFSRPVAHIDFVPMMTRLAGLPEWRGFQGRRPFVTPGAPPVFLVANGLVREYGVVRWPWKLLSRTWPQRIIELYNLQNDPREQRNLARVYPTIAGELHAQVESWRTCQLSYYSDPQAYRRLAPPRLD